ncbi:MAG TPA: SgcJ/EcaC family oxidoreductase [Pyrinomonadaceae bacterium]|nr:SgcJ/EcaC family oxidoreductase [Pyrinomonadaceae bacterium]
MGQSKKYRKTLLVILLLSLASACQNQMAHDNHGGDENAVKALDAEWAKAAGSKDVDKTVSYYSDDAIVLPPNSPPVTSKEQIRAMWQGMLRAPGFSGGWTATKVDVAHSGDLAYVTGSYEMTENDAGGKPQTDKGKYLEVWKKQADGSWKCVADMFSTNLPAAIPAEKKVELSKKTK